MMNIFIIDAIRIFLKFKGFAYFKKFFYFTFSRGGIIQFRVNFENRQS